MPIFIETTEWDSAAGFRELEPVALSNVIYQVQSERMFHVHQVDGANSSALTFSVPVV